MQTEIFNNKKIKPKKLLDFGFTQKNKEFYLEKPLIDNQFNLIIAISESGIVKTKLIETESGDLYTLHLVEGAEGNFVGQVKDEYNRILEEIAEKCFEPNVFKNEVTLKLIDYIKDKYGDELEFLWDKFKGNAVVRRKDNSKWYAIFLTIPKSKLGFQNETAVEIIDLRAENVESIIDNVSIYPGYHMNKKHWITMLLDNSANINDLKRRIDDSYLLAKKKK